MQEVNNQPTQPEFTSLTENQPMETGKPFSFNRRQLILIGAVAGLVLLVLFSLGVRAGEKRVLRKYFAQPTPTLTPTLPSPTTVPTLTPTSTSPSDSSTRDRTDRKEIPSSGTVCERDIDCLSCLAVPGTPIVNCDAGRCVNGVCVWEEKEYRPKKHE